MNNCPSRLPKSKRWCRRGWAGLSLLLALLVLVTPPHLASAAGAGQTTDSAASPESALELTFTGLDRIIVKTIVDEPPPGYRRWGALYRNDTLIATAVGEHYYQDLDLPPGEAFVYKLFVYTQDEDTGEIQTSGPYTTPSTTTGQVRGDVPLDMTWEGDTWNLVGWVTVPKGVTLTIKPGTTVTGVGSQGTSFHVQNGGYLEVSGATLEALWVEHDDLYGHYGNVSITDSYLDTVVIFANGLDFSRNQGQNCTIWNYYNTAKSKARYAENVFTGSQFNISFRWAEFAADYERRPEITIENNDFDFLGIESGYPESTLNRTWVKIRNNEVTQGIYVTGKDAERRFAGNLDIENNYTPLIDVEFAYVAEIYDNTVVGDGSPNYGIFLGSEVKYTRVERNTLRQANITLKQSSSPPPSYNVFEENIAPGGWLNLWYGEHNNFYDNAFKGVVAPPGSLANTWFRLSGPGPNVVGGPQKGGNWYSDYAGVDANGDGFGDTPHVIATGNVDQYPLVMDNPGPDFAVDPFQFGQSDVALAPDRHYILPLDVQVANDGWVAADNVPVVFYDSTGLIETQVVPHFGVGDDPIPLHLDWDITPLLLRSNGLANLWLKVIADPDDTFGDTIRANNERSYSLQVDGRPHPDFKTSMPFDAGYFVDQAQVDNLVTALVDWNGVFSNATSLTYGDVWFDLNGTATSVLGQEWGASRLYNMGTDFQPFPGCGNNTLQIWASHPIAGGALTSPQTVFQPTVLPYPDWVEWAQANIPGSDASLGVTPNPPLAEYSYGFPFPSPPLSAQWTPPTSVPYLGGEPLGLAPSQAVVAMSSRSNGGGTASVTGTTTYTLAGLSTIGTWWGAGQTDLSCESGMTLPRAEMNLSITVAVTAEQKLADVVPDSQAAGDWPVAGRRMDWLADSVQVPARFTPNVDLRTAFRSESGQLAFIPGTGSAPLDAQVALVTRPAPGISASVYGGGRSSVAVQVPPNPDYLQGVDIALYFEAHLQTGPFEGEYDYGVDCHYPGVCQAARSVGTSGSPTWRLIPRDYAGPGYAAFAGTSREAAAGSTETVLVTNAYPYAEPALALSTSGQRLLAYVHDDPGQPAGRGNEIYVLRHDGAWNGPTAITADQQPDFSPAAAYDADGDGLLVWERSTLPMGITPTLDITYARSLEVAYATYSGGVWSSPTLLTTDALMDRAPRLARGQDGSLLALWETGDGYDSLGTASHPLTLTYATWDGAAWSVPAPAAAGLQDVVATAVAAYSATQAALVYVVDADGVLTTTADTDLYYSTFDGATWSAPSPIADGAGLTDAAPALAYDTYGHLHLLWLRDGDLVWLDNSWDLGNAQLVRPGSTAAGFLSFSLAGDASGNLALVWQTVDEQGADLAYTIYDGTAGLWGADQTLLADAGVEASPSAAFAAGSLYAAYAKAQTELVTRTYEIAPGEFVTVTHVPQAGPSDLAFLAHTVGRDLTFEGLAVEPANPAPGQAVTVTAMLRNAGDLAVASPQVTFYDGPATLTTVTLSQALGGGQSAPVEAGWTVPLTPAAPHLLRAEADPNGVVAETDEANNEVSLATSLPDLTVDLLYLSHGAGQITVTTRLHNAGATDVLQAFTVDLRVGDAYTGTLAASLPVDDSLPAGGAITLTQTLTDLLPLAGQGDRLWATADAGAAILEADEGNNSDYAPFGLLPDLTLAAEDIQGNGPVTILVHNDGLSAASGVSLAVRQGGSTGPLLYSGVVGDLAVGESRSITFMPPVGQVELWVQVDPDNTLAELNEGNNLAIRALEIAYWVYLPIVAR